MARKTKFDNIDSIMKSAAMQENQQEFSHAKIIKNTLLDIELDKIKKNPYQPRIEINKDELVDLANSIKENGLLHPIIVNKISSDSYELIAGHRRYAAHKLLEEKTIKAIVLLEVKKNSQEYKTKMALGALIENIQRQNLDIIETAIAFQNILDDQIVKSKDELSKFTGKSNAYISKILSILKLNNKILQDLKKNKTIKDIELLYELQKIKDLDKQYMLYKQIVAGTFTRDELRKYNKNLKLANNKSTTIDSKQPYTIKVTKNKINLTTSLTTLSDIEKIKLQDEIKQVVEKYFKNYKK